MTDRSMQIEMPDPQEMLLSLLQLWQLPIALGSCCLKMMLEVAVLLPSHLHAARHHQPHDQLAIPPEIEVESEQSLFA